MTDKQIIARLKTDLDFERTKRKSLQVDLKVKEQELKNICKAFDIEYAIDEETGNLIGRCNKLYKKEQECEELRTDIKDIANLLDLDTVEEYSFSNIELEIKELKQQLDQLKAENDTLRQFLSKEPLALQALQSGYASYKKSSDVFYEMVKQYKQTLTEIKEIAEEEVHTRMLFADKESFCDFNKILQKISEVIK